MDLKDAFRKDIERHTFLTFADFKTALTLFCKTYGTRFKIGKSWRYHEGDPRKESLVYALAIFHCICQRTTQCESAFKLGCKKGSLCVIDSTMRHNHDKIPDDPECVVDHMQQFQNIVLSAPLNTFSEVLARIKEFEQLTGTPFRVGRSDVCKDGDKAKEFCRYKRITYECVHYGRRRSFAKIIIGTRSSRIGCPAKFDVKAVNGGFRVTAIVMKHNHLVSPELAKFYRPTLKCPSKLMTESQTHTVHELQHEPSSQQLGIITTPGRTRDPIVPSRPDWLANPLLLMKGSNENGLLAIRHQSSILTDAEKRLLMSTKMQHLLDMACVSGTARFNQCMETLESLEEQWNKQDNLLLVKNDSLKDNPNNRYLR